MKKLFVTLLSILACEAAYALPTGNPAEASLLNEGNWDDCGSAGFCDPWFSWCEAFNVRFGFWGDYVFDRHLKIDDAPNRDKLHRSRLNTNAAIVVLNVINRYEVFATFGASHFWQTSNAVSYSGPLNSTLTMETQTDFSWSVGGRATLWQWGCTMLGLEGQYFSFRPKVHLVEFGKDNSVYPDNISRLHYHEWQLGLGISHRINMFVPYAAVNYSNAHLRFTHPNLTIQTAETPLNLFNQKSAKQWGYSIGTSILVCEQAFVSVEGRFANEKALYVTGHVRF